MLQQGWTGHALFSWQRTQGGGEPLDEMDLQVQTADGRPQQDLLQQTGKVSVGTTGQKGRGISGGTVIRVLNFEFWTRINYFEHELYFLNTNNSNNTNFFEHDFLLNTNYIFEHE